MDDTVGHLDIVGSASGLTHDETSSITDTDSSAATPKVAPIIDIAFDFGQFEISCEFSSHLPFPQVLLTVY